MKRTLLRPVVLALIAAIAWGGPLIASAEGALPTTPEGVPVAWSGWIGDHAPVAVLLWASWVPDADEALADLDRISAAAEARGLDLVVVVVQEPIEEARDAIGGADVEWFHDRYGDLLKEYRVVSIPLLLVFSADGKVTERVAVTSEALQAWSGK
jgi:thiol-disulfide isomerase/thioredoxin